MLQLTGALQKTHLDNFTYQTTPKFELFQLQVHTKMHPITSNSQFFSSNTSNDIESFHLDRIRQPKHTC